MYLILQYYEVFEFVHISTPSMKIKKYSGVDVVMYDDLYELKYTLHNIIDRISKTSKLDIWTIFMREAEL